MLVACVAHGYQFKISNHQLCAILSIHNINTLHDIIKKYYLDSV